MIREEVKILIVEDDSDRRKMYRKMLQGHPNLRIVAEAETQKEAEEILKEGGIDAIILDLELPEGSGVFLLEEMVYMNIPKPFVVVVTNVVSQTIYETIRELGADYICSKKEIMDTPHIPFSIIEISGAYRKELIQRGETIGPINARTKEMLYTKELELELSRFCVPLTQASGRVLKQAILIALLCEDENFQITNHVYPVLAKRMNVSVKSVEKNLRNAIEKIWTKENAKKILEMYDYSWSRGSGRPTNAEFVINIAEKIRLK